MVKIKTLLFALLLVIGLVYVGTKGYVYYKSKTALDKIIQMTSPIVQIDYASIGSELTGVIFIDNMRITPNGTNEEITIKRVSISGNGIRFLLNLGDGFSSSEFPAQIDVAFDQLKAPVSTSFLSDLASSLSKGKDGLKVETCSIPGILNATGLDELDINTITINGSLGYIYDKDLNQAEILLKYDLAGIESMLLNLRVSQITTQGMLGPGKLPIIEQLHLVKQYDPAYVKQITTHCATEASQSTATFIDDLFTQSDEYYINSLGFVPGPGLSELFKQLVTNAGTVDIRATPSSEITPALLKAYRPEDLVDLFGVTANYNGTPVKDLSFSMQSSISKKQQQSPSRTPQVVSAPTPLNQLQQKAKSKPKLSYLDTDISELKNYKNYMVRAYTRGNSIPKQGILASITHTINIEHLVFGGKITSHLYKDSIERIEVLRKEMPEDK